MDGFPQSRCRMPSGVAHVGLGAAAVASDFGLAFEEYGSAERLPRPKSGEVVEDYSQHPAEKFQCLILCSPFCNIVSARLVSGVYSESF